MSRFLALLLVSLLFLPAFVGAQSTESAESSASEAAKPEEAPAQEKLEEPAVLSLRLQPMTKEELKSELDSWQQKLKQKVQERVQEQIRKLDLEGEAKSQSTDRISALDLEVAEIAERYTIVMRAYRDKGGEIKEYESYLAGIGGLQLPTDNVFDLGKVLYNWIVSDSGGIKWGLRLASFLGILIAFRILAGILASLVRRATGRIKKGSDLMRHFFVNITRRMIMIIGIVVAVQQLGVDVGPLLAAIGAAGFIIGFALQGTLSNFAAGLMILMYRPFDVGDAVEVAGVSGSVEKMTLVSTTIKSWDNKQIVVPNNSIWGGIITNITGNPIRRVDLKFGIGYSDDIAKAEKVLTEIIESHENVLKDPAPTIKLHELGDSSVNFVVRPWTKTSDYWGLYWDITRKVKERFDAEGISIPFPQRDVHLFYENAPVGEQKPA